MDKVVIGMSGGVDSAVAASILLEKGFEVEAVFMKNWEDESEFCTSASDYNDALQVCDRLNIRLHSVNFTREYWDRVFESFLEEHKKGRTPNPDILCNTEIKFREFLNYALDLGASKIATGHYVRRTSVGEKVILKKGIDERKDQSYFLYGLNQKQISDSIFPLGDFTKEKVRLKAKELGFYNYNKKDSVGICFIGKRNFKDFIKRYLPLEPGLMKTTNGDFVGEHDGLMYYTIGQRKGLGIGGGFSGLSEPWYVVGKDLTNNELIVCQGRSNSALYHRYVQCSELNWIAGSPPSKGGLSAKVRYRSKDKSCTIISLDNDKIGLEFKEPCFGLTPGQSVVLYDQEICLGGAVIDSYNNE